MNWAIKDVDLDDGGRRVVANGELDLAAAPSVEDAGSRALEAGVQHLELDLQEVTFIDSTAIRAVINLHEAMLAAGGRLVVRCAAGNVLRVLEIAGVDKLLTVLRPDPHPVVTEPVQRIPR